MGEAHWAPLQYDRRQSDGDPAQRDQQGARLSTHDIRRNALGDVNIEPLLASGVLLRLDQLAALVPPPAGAASPPRERAENGNGAAAEKPNYPASIAARPIGKNK